MLLDLPNISERRQSQRYDIDLPVDLIQDNGNILPVSARNISGNGMQLICDTWVTDQIEPRGIQSHSINHLRFKTAAELPVEDTNLKFYANCRIISVQRLSQDEYILSMVFLNFENGSDTALDKFIAQYRQTNVIHKGVVGEYC